MNRRVYVYSGIVLLMIIFAYATFAADGKKQVPDKEDFKEEKDEEMPSVRDILKKAEELRELYGEEGIDPSIPEAGERWDAKKSRGILIEKDPSRYTMRYRLVPEGFRAYKDDSRDYNAPPIGGYFVPGRESLLPERKLLKPRGGYNNNRGEPRFRGNRGYFRLPKGNEKDPALYEGMVPEELFPEFNESYPKSDPPPGLPELEQNDGFKAKTPKKHIKRYFRIKPKTDGESIESEVDSDK
ncbi:MAG: hypothetical protein ACOX5R_11085 [bacterium]|jgi:hypothetical protein